ncbi:MAG: response regulator transcription factor [Calditrichia bacterium]
MGNDFVDKSRILLVEDEETLGLGLEFNLTEEGYEVIWAKNGKEAAQFIRSAEFDLIILDIMVPYLDGFEIAKIARREYPRIPILILSARAGVKDRIRGLELGADDYLTKPFHLQELLLRVAGMLKRKAWYKDTADQNPVFKFGRNEIDFRDFSCVADRRQFQLTFHEAMVLKYLIDHRNTIVSRKDLLENVWNTSSEIETRTIDNFIMRLRKYFEPDPAQPVYIKSVRSVGYIFSTSEDE